MIICHSKKFVFVHNPKAGGTSINASLRKFHEDEFPMYGFTTKDGHVINCQHVRFLELRRYFPEKFDQIKNYAWFGLFRDPVSRFISSVQNFEKSYGATEPMFLSNDDIVKLVLRYADKLDRSFCEKLEYIMFWPQSGFLTFPDTAVTTKIFQLEKPAEFVAWISGLTGESFHLRNSNQTFYVPTPAFLQDILTVKAKQRIRKILPTPALGALLSLLQVAQRRRISGPNFGPLIADKIREFYVEDFALQRRLEAEADPR